MAELNRRNSAGMGQGRNRGNCRGMQGGSSTGMNAPGTCRGLGFRQDNQANMVPAEPTVDSENRLKTPNLEMLKEQAERMKRALQNIQEQIRSFTEK